MFCTLLLLISVDSHRQLRGFTDCGKMLWKTITGKVAVVVANREIVRHAVASNSLLEGISQRIYRL
jgi:hypothetical protein